MRHAHRPRIVLPFALLVAGVIAGSAWAGGTRHESHVIKIKPGQSEVIELDVTELGLGESRSFVTDSGSTVDVLKGADGIEIYIDGERVDASFGDAALNERIIAIHEDMDVECHADDDTECDNHFAYAWSTDDEFSGDEGDRIVVMRKHIEVTCEGDEECEENVWISDAGELHEVDDTHVVVIEKKEIDNARD